MASATAERRRHFHRVIFFFFNDPATTEFYTLSLHDALPIYYERTVCWAGGVGNSHLGGDLRAGQPRSVLIEIDVDRVRRPTPPIIFALDIHLVHYPRL